MEKETVVQQAHAVCHTAFRPVAVKRLKRVLSSLRLKFLLLSRPHTKALYLTLNAKIIASSKVSPGRSTVPG